jgi:hypothetical protein
MKKPLFLLLFFSVAQLFADPIIGSRQLTIDVAYAYVLTHMTYVSDTELYKVHEGSYAPSQEEVVAHNFKGDCKAYAVLFAYIVHRMLPDAKIEFVAVYQKHHTMGHMEVDVDGTRYFCAKGYAIEVHKWSYDEYMNIVHSTHDLEVPESDLIKIQ